MFHRPWRVGGLLTAGFLVACTAAPVTGAAGATVAVKMRQVFRTMAAAKTAADVDHLHLRLMQAYSGVIQSEGDWVGTSDAQFTQVPDGTYELAADAVDRQGNSLVIGGEQYSGNQVTVQAPFVTYSDGSDALLVQLAMLGATGEDLAAAVDLQDGPAWSGSVGLNCALPTDGSILGTYPYAGTIDTVAGDGRQAFGGDQGPARSAALSGPAGVAIDPSGNLIISDSGNGRLRVVSNAACTAFGLTMARAQIYTLAGGGWSGADGAAATDRVLGTPAAVTADRQGNYYWVDPVQNAVLMVPKRTGTYFGVAMSANTVWTVPTAAVLQPAGIAVDSLGNLFVSDTGHHKVVMIPVEAGTYFGIPMPAAATVTIAGDGDAGAGGPGLLGTESSLRRPEGLAVDASGSVYIADTGNHRVVVLARRTAHLFGQDMEAGYLYALAGTGSAGDGADDRGAVTSALSGPRGVAVDGLRGLVIADTGNHRVRYVPMVTGSYFGRLMTEAHSYVLAGYYGAGFAGDGGAGTVAKLNGPAAVAVDRAGDVVVADQGNHRVRLIANVTHAWQ